MVIIPYYVVIWIYIFKWLTCISASGDVVGFFPLHHETFIRFHNFNFLSEVYHLLINSSREWPRLWLDSCSKISSYLHFNRGRNFRYYSHFILGEFRIQDSGKVNGRRLSEILMQIFWAISLFISLEQMPFSHFPVNKRKNICTENWLSYCM